MSVSEIIVDTCVGLSIHLSMNSAIDLSIDRSLSFILIVSILYDWLVGWLDILTNTTLSRGYRYCWFEQSPRTIDGVVGNKRGVSMAADGATAADAGSKPHCCSAGNHRRT